MITVPLLYGIGTKPTGNPEVILPLNLELVKKSTGEGEGYAIQTDGMVNFIEGNGVDRGGINWNGRYFRVSGTDLIEIYKDGTKVVRGTIPGDTLCRFDYSFDTLSISNGQNLYFYSNENKQQIASINDFGQVLDHKFMDGYFFTIDGANIVQSDLTDKTKANPLKYGSSELDPDNIVALQRIRGELYVINEYTTEVFNNVGGTNFVLARVNGAQSMVGCVGTHANAVLNDTLVQVGSSRGSAISIWALSRGDVKRISTKDIDYELNKLTETERRAIQLEVKLYFNGNKLLVHLPKFSYMYDSDNGVWSQLQSNENGYRARNLVLWESNWHCGDTQSNYLGILDENVKSHFGDKVDYQLVTMLLDNAGDKMILHQVNLLISTSNSSEESTIGMSVSKDNGTTYSAIRYKNIHPGKRDQQPIWVKMGMFKTNMTIKFTWNSDAVLVVKKLLVALETLSYGK